MEESQCAGRGGSSWFCTGPASSGLWSRHASGSTFLEMTESGMPCALLRMARQSEPEQHTNPKPLRLPLNFNNLTKVLKPGGSVWGFAGKGIEEDSGNTPL